MNYISTRDPAKKPYSAAQVIKMGLAPDGGLFLPESIPALTREEVFALCKESYPVRAAKILEKFLTDYTYEELLADCTAAYSEASFPGGAAPLVKINESLYSLELWHGPTAAFKDMALQLMPRLLSRALVKTGESRDALILVATSGDTGKAALEGYKDIDHIRMMVFYPVDGVSRVQKLQMATQTGSNLSVCAIRGNFDDAQTGVKKLFSDAEMAEKLDQQGVFFSSANSINWGRLVPQIVYYVSAYCDLLSRGDIEYGEEIDICVPTGNFGNIFAAYIAKCMGLPLNRLVCGSNTNRILTDFLNSGTYDRNRPFHLTMSPSMDILISSNLERLLYLCAGVENNKAYMNDLMSGGCYTVPADIMAAIHKNFAGYSTDEAATQKTILDYYNNYNYLADTHTAVGLNCAEQFRAAEGATRKMVVASTASPYKFAADVLASLKGCGRDEITDPLAALDELSALSGTEIPYPLKGLATRKVNFTEVIDAAEMPEAVLGYVANK